MRNLDDLEKNALFFWPSHLTEMAANVSIIPKLIETQEDFISLLVTANKDPFAWKDALKLTNNLSPNLFLKHLMVLADVGGEKTQRLSREIKNIIGDKMIFMWNGAQYEYAFKALEGNRPWSNKNIKVDGEGLLKSKELSSMMEDVSNFILYAAACTNGQIPVEFLDKCVIGSLIGNKVALEKFVKQRYIWVSKITGGATTNTLGQLAQTYVKTYLQKRLPGWDLSRSTIPDISQNERTNMAFDVVTKSPTGKYVAIEASFQVTTNSVIERKAGQAKDRQAVLHAKGHKIAYVIDGSGNFTRSSALTTICKYSDCTVTYHDSELDTLVSYIKQIEAE